MNQSEQANILTCVYCGHEYPAGTPASGADVSALTEHIKVCEKHPMRKLQEAHTDLRDRMLGILGSDLYEQVCLQRTTEQFLEWFHRSYKVVSVKAPASHIINCQIAASLCHWTKQVEAMLPLNVPPAARRKLNRFGDTLRQHLLNQNS